MKHLTLSLLLILILTAGACEGTKKQSESGNAIAVAPVGERPFEAERAYQHIKAQLAFGPRVPNTPAHKACAEYLASTLRGYNMQVTEQEALLTAYDDTQLEAVNIIAAYRPEATERVMLFAHWDTRPVADHDPNPSNRHKPIPGANDGASGVAVLLEIARLLSEVGLPNELGVDIMLFDAEDYGVPEGVEYDGDSTDTWALGTQYWTHNPHRPNYAPRFGILLDMVGAEGATFYREYFSQEYAGKYVTLIWQTAEALGHGKYFVNKLGGAATDDHYFVIRNLRIPAVDIIQYDPQSPTGFFGSYWHTHQDDLHTISRATLQAVGETVWQVLVNL